MVDIFLFPRLGGLEFHGGEGADVELVDHQAVAVDDIPGAGGAACRPGRQGACRGRSRPRGHVEPAEQSSLGVTETASERRQTHLTGDALPQRRRARVVKRPASDLPSDTTSRQVTRREMSNTGKLNYSFTREVRWFRCQLFMIKQIPAKLPAASFFLTLSFYGRKLKHTTCIYIYVCTAAIHRTAFVPRLSIGFITIMGKRVSQELTFLIIAQFINEKRNKSMKISQMGAKAKAQISLSETKQKKQKELIVKLRPPPR